MGPEPTVRVGGAQTIHGLSTDVQLKLPKFDPDKFVDTHQPLQCTPCANLSMGDRTRAHGARGWGSAKLSRLDPLNLSIAVTADGAVQHQNCWFNSAVARVLTRHLKDKPMRRHVVKLTCRCFCKIRTWPKTMTACSIITGRRPTGSAGTGQ